MHVSLYGDGKRDFIFYSIESYSNRDLKEHIRYVLFRNKFLSIEGGHGLALVAKLLYVSKSN